MNKFCKSSLCVEKVCESYVLIGRRAVDVPGVADAVRLTVLILISVKLCRLFVLRAFGLEDSFAKSANKDFSEILFFVPVMC